MCDYSHSTVYSSYTHQADGVSAGRRLWVMLSREDRVQVVLSIQPLVGEEDRRLVTEALTQLEGVHAAHVDVGRGVVRVDGVASDVELLATLEALGKRAAIVTHVRDARSSHPAWSPSPVCACFSLSS